MKSNSDKRHVIVSTYGIAEIQIGDSVVKSMKSY